MSHQNYERFLREKGFSEDEIKKDLAYREAQREELDKEKHKRQMKKYLQQHKFKNRRESYPGKGSFAEYCLYN